MPSKRASNRTGLHVAVRTDLRDSAKERLHADGASMTQLVELAFAEYLAGRLVFPSDDAAADGPRERLAAYLAAHDAKYDDEYEGAGGTSTRTELARLVTRDGTFVVSVEDLRAVLPR